jgi:hypothetical protein
MESYPLGLSMLESVIWISCQRAFKQGMRGRHTKTAKLCVPETRVL